MRSPCLFSGVRHVLRQALKDVVLGVGVRRIHRAFKDRAAGKDNAVGAQPFTSALYEILDVEMLRDLLGDPLAKPGVNLRIKRTPPEVLGNFTLIVAFGIPPYLTRECNQWRQV